MLLSQGRAEHQGPGAPVQRDHGLLRGRAADDGAPGRPVRFAWRAGSSGISPTRRRRKSAHPGARRRVPREEGRRPRAGTIQAEETPGRCAAQAEGEGDEGGAQ